MRKLVLATIVFCSSFLLLFSEGVFALPVGTVCERVFESAEWSANLQFVERAHAKKSKEIGSVISRETGEILAKQELDSAGGHLDSDLMSLMRGNIFTHNHPSGGSFSAEDIVTAIVTGTAEFRATAGLTVYSLAWKVIPAELANSPERAHLFIESEKRAIGESYRAALTHKKINPPSDKLARAIWQSEYFMRELVKRNTWLIYTRTSLSQ